MAFSPVSPSAPTEKSNSFIFRPIPLTPPLQVQHDSEHEQPKPTQDSKRDFSRLKNTHTYAPENRPRDLNQIRTTVHRVQKVDSCYGISSCAIIMVILIFIMYMHVLILPDLHETLRLTKIYVRQISQMPLPTPRNSTL
jgi:hypothetical protein